MKNYYCDLHVHTGATSEGRPVKITASRGLVFDSIVRESLSRKGMDMIAVVDCASPGVLRDIRKMVSDGELYPLPEGGLLHRERLTVIPASEVETVEESGGVSHHIAYFPTIKSISDFSRVMSRYITNIELSSQRASLTSAEFLNVVKSMGGVLVPAHAFTPHKSLYGNAGKSMREVFGDSASEISALELGLSADSSIGDRLSELRNITFLSNSDAHSIPKIAREYNVIRMERPNFRELILSFFRQGGRGVIANVGMNPKLGRYHRTFCRKCQRVVASVPPPVLKCPFCNAEGKDIVRGVYDRIAEIADQPEPNPPEHRPPYKYQVPLMFVPGMNKRVMEHLLGMFGSEMAILNHVSSGELEKALPPELARDLLSARSGNLSLTAGGGGRHGRVEEKEILYDQIGINFE